MGHNDYLEKLRFEMRMLRTAELRAVAEGKYQEALKIGNQIETLRNQIDEFLKG